MIVYGCKLMVGPSGHHWIGLPSNKQTNKDGTPRLDPKGKALWAPIVDFADRAARDRFCHIVLDALGRAHPQALGDAP
jgi:hypothetical protein